ncbi:MAG: Formylmethanofuran dehydrogenase, subunit A [Methanomicrobiales archaeon 53_19]|uniref:formylmethanofuran dehydrogenase subunit A n=1 Tax=Methanocalculus sp. TaxID=2004547 RepID=UPI00074917FE|nr:formylmethanofuran dehydrogenase subunit A [Methanocalculus sp.]KUK71085.1 MAG: Formylmethanofuran dehydrogenase, subunit A [Methanocalculus sp. 52_23]KUL03939.1 MAG: Formylmethanofuran dehydrogenase, subunit A [Methanomicrobiales archaeon 53_19]HIJ06327.1 formylmethanofuran dehydrogenase subunit A [Methanocalculus sp.]
MAEILLKNAYVIDPISGINGEVMDIAISGGKIVEEVSSKPEVIDCQGCLTLPGGIDSHTHISGTKVNFGRYMSPEDMRAGRTAKKGPMHITSGYSVPTTYGNSYRYSALGYTTLVEGAVAPLEARHTHEEFKFTPLQDSCANILFDGNWGMLRALEEGDIKRAAAIIAWTLNAVKGFAIKLTNPGGTEAWGFGKNVSCINEKIPTFDLTPAEIIKGAIRANELLHLPHSVHLHCNNLGTPGNFTCTIGTFGHVPDLNDKRQTLYATHVQFHSYGGTGWSDFCSKSEPVANMVNFRPQIVIDMGQVMFGRTTTMTADGPMEFNLYRLHHDKWSNHDVELETGSGIIPVNYRKKNLVNSIMWAIGLELALLVKNPWQCLLTTDNPNGAPFIKYPEIIALLMSKRYRDAEFAMIHQDTEKRVPLPAIDRELDWHDIAVMTRAGQARALGITDLGKGYLMPGAEADIAIYPIKTDEIDPSAEYEKIIQGFARTEYTIKRGRVVSRRGDAIIDGENTTFWVKPKVPAAYDIQHDPTFMELFERNYSVRMSNYPVQEEYLHRNHCIETETDL